MLNVFCYVTFIPKTTIYFSTLPSFTLKLPPTFATANEQFYYGISQPAPKGVQLAFQTEGPGTVSGSSVAFAASLTSLTVEAGQRYTFEFFAFSTNNVWAGKLLYVANAGANSITAYALTAQGNIAPLRTLSGSATGLTKPAAIAVDADGNLIVANALTNGGLIEIFPEGANGNVKPARTFRVAQTPTAIGVDPLNANIYVGLSDYSAGLSGNPTVGVFTASGLLLRTVSNFTDTTATPAPGQDQLSGVGAPLVALDRQAELIVGVDLQARDQFSHELQVFAPNSGRNDPSIFSTSYCCDPNACCSGVGPAYASGTDHVFAANPAKLIEFTNHTFAIVRQTSNLAFTPVGLAVDPSGQNVYTSDGVATVYRFTDDASNGFVSNTPIFGARTGLSQPSSLAVGNP